MPDNTMKGTQSTPAVPVAGEVSLLEEIIKEKEGGRTPEQRKRTVSQMRTFLGRRRDLIEAPETAPVGELEAAILEEMARIDGELSVRLDGIMHSPAFQQVEATWRGLHKLVSESELAESLKIRVLDVDKKELARDLKGDYLDSVLFRKIHEQGYGQLGKEPYGVLVGDYEFTHEEDDVALLTKISQVAAVSHAPFIAGASPKLFGWNRYSDLDSAGALMKVFQGDEYAHWRNFREHPNSRYCGLVLPHVLLRTPYRKSVEATEFSYDETVEGKESGNYLWGNAAWAYAECLTAAFFNYGWCTAIRGVEGGGLLELPFYVEKREGVVQKAGPTDVIITDGREKDFSNHGFISLVQIENSPRAAFFSGQSCQKAKQYYEDEAMASAELSARLPNIFAVSRFAHYLKAILRDKIGLFMSRDDCESFLNRWISNYVLKKVGADQEDKARYPLKEARIVVEDVAGHPGHYTAKAYLRPHYQLEEIAISMRLVANLPNVTK